MDHIHELIEKYFNDRCTADEAKQVLKWFDTPEGQDYLNRNLDADISRVDEDLVRYMVPGLDSEKLLRSIRMEILKKKPVKKGGATGLFVKAAAAVLVIFTASLFTYTTYQPDSAEIEGPTPAYYATSDDQQQEITLEDGTTIRLNSNSEIRISRSFSNDPDGRRQVELSGEAYFDVVHNPDRPFIIHAEGATVEVLGTAFNVKALPSASDVQLAVMDGRVSFSGLKTEVENSSVILEKGQFGYMDLEKHTIDIEEFGVENYMNWMRGRLVFDELTLDKVCTQLSRFYDLTCGYSDETFKNLTLTADFSNDSLEKTLSVISLSLGVEYQKFGDQVLWLEKSEES